MKFSVVVVLASLSVAVSATVLPRQNAQTSLGAYALSRLRLFLTLSQSCKAISSLQDWPTTARIFRTLVRRLLWPIPVSDLAAGQVASLTSTNNFINYCLTTNLANTEGKQSNNPSCNSAPIGVIPASTKVPSLRFQSPVNQQTLRARQPITFQIKVNNFEAGNQVNLDTNYLTAPQTLNGAGLIKGFVTVACDARTSFQDTTPPRIEAPAAFQVSDSKEIFRTATDFLIGHCFACSERSCLLDYGWRTCRRHIPMHCHSLFYQREPSHHTQGSAWCYD